MGRQTIPSNATQVHSGPTFDIYQREQELFDGSYKTFELARMADAVKVLLIDIQEQKIIMVQDEQPGLTRLTFAGGLVEQGENLLQAAAREVEEETGYHYTHIEHIISLPYTHRVVGETHYYIASGLMKTDTANPDRGSERITLLSYGFDEFIDYICNPEHHSYFSYYIITTYIITHQQNKLKKLLFGE
ncbi:hypothetical protein XF24_00684 [candidate division SR1 bacterium Aalborg_AAW-1]|nr:hypothetical protein XF24_00684 [candidate division SR1 bacterium Aalborg_AAW-1]